MMNLLNKHILLGASLTELKVIKLCSRKFIRAIVYTCGGSRGRMLLNEPALKGVGSLNKYNVEFLSTSARTHRDLNQILTIVCYQVGCRKSDLFTFAYPFHNLRLQNHVFP
ncbi:hypothetical protein SKAU_G00068040 [Synaphobranchus kaupii]|uniref:Uncharacterized protein n=1 Tax=Synaphobranchus kaupii TaxID=118154 RepID=A0A9Q1G7D2_SYNKA|nr:hypothetical protein SKAU_G00068040 [Synaphobranchus kaupii]